MLGSGWVGVAEGLGSTLAELPLAELPHVPAPTVAGHSGVARAVGAYARWRDTLAVVTTEPAALDPALAASPAPSEPSATGAP